MGEDWYRVLPVVYRLLDLVLFLPLGTLEEDRFLFGYPIYYHGCFANIFASDQKDEMINRKHAIVFAPTVTVKSSPDASGTDLFVLHEGTNVTVKSTLGEWSEIELEDGNVGWMPSKDIEKI